MTNTKMLHEIKRMLFDVAGGGSRQLTEVETDLLQTNILLSEAIDKLGASFILLHQSVRNQQDTMELLLDPRQLAVPQLKDRLKEMGNDIDTQVNSVVTCLQFQDMTSQLIERILKRVIGLRNVLGVLETSSFEFSAENEETEAVVDLLRATNLTMEEQLIALENGLWKTVRQKHMQSGDIDLF
ncbi:chemotaxis protein [Herbaspirillum sp. RTI4]|uniref:chemotaxis protein n=1 Tax=Herbaspirillum sp. RTI4 TaxID=3048640 RepID=UPI002AB37E15|nr:chemotaxis protein [Herbaspirillum sp. RTI4]MDY7578576.1 chemotaxis protein [Herbaspirillum sp. RTI4]MEA9981118.1 chemotaxis protein [Herbaspirillum sp. RTI4]